MLFVFILVALLVPGRAVSIQDSDEGETGQLLATVNELSSTVARMDNRMVAMETKMEQLDAENALLRQRLAALESSGWSNANVHPGPNVKDPTRRQLLGENETVAFLASLDSMRQEQHLMTNQIVQFDHVLTNIGSGFDVSNGVFTAPRNGVYLISATVMSWIDSEVRAAIMVNGRRTVSCFGHGSVGRHEQGSQVAVLHLREGDAVTVENIDLADVTIYGDKYTSFTGALLYPTA